MLAGLAAGCDNLRVGLEDNVFMKKGEYATNAQLVERAVKLGILAGREIATAAEAREILASSLRRAFFISRKLTWKRRMRDEIRF